MYSLEIVLSLVALAAIALAFIVVRGAKRANN
jgi:hypothetical protein